LEEMTDCFSLFWELLEITTNFMKKCDDAHSLFPNNIEFF